MTRSNRILILNIYYMLSYAFSDLRTLNYERVGSESFESVADLMAEILAIGTAKQLKQGLYRQYVTSHQSLPTLRGKLDLVGSARNLASSKRLLECYVDDLSVDNLFNQIIHTCLLLLLSDADVAPARRNALKRLLPYFSQIQTIHPSAIPWNTITFQRNNRSYELLLHICSFIINRQLIDPNKETVRLLQFSEQHLHHLYEKFVLAYFQRHFPQFRACAEEVKWNVNSSSSVGLAFLPKMITDISLHYKGRTLIIDTKFYSDILRGGQNRDAFISANLYQILAYVTNKDTLRDGSVSGLLLYAQTEHEIVPDSHFQMLGSPSTIYVRALDLNCPFSSIRQRLDSIASLLLNP